MFLAAHHCVPAHCANGFFLFIYLFFIFSKTPPLFLTSLFILSPTPLVALYVFVSPAADCCSSNLCTRLGMFFTLFISLPVSAPPVSPLVHYLPPSFGHGGSFTHGYYFERDVPLFSSRELHLEMFIVLYWKTAALEQCVKMSQMDS